MNSVRINNVGVLILSAIDKTLQLSGFEVNESNTFKRSQTHSEEFEKEIPGFLHRMKMKSKICLGRRKYQGMTDQNSPK